MSIDELTIKSGVSKSTISKIENYKMAPSITVLCKLCIALNVDIKAMVDCERGNCDDDGW